MSGTKAISLPHTPNPACDFKIYQDVSHLNSLQLLCLESGTTWLFTWQLIAHWSVKSYLEFSLWSQPCFFPLLSNKYLTTPIFGVHSLYAFTCLLKYLQHCIILSHLLFFLFPIKVVNLLSKEARCDSALGADDGYMVRIIIFKPTVHFMHCIIYHTILKNRK